MATTTVRPKPARTASKRAPSANAKVNSNTTLTLHLNLNAVADAASRATSVGGDTARRAKPQGGQTKGQNGRPAQTATSTAGAANNPSVNQPRQNRPRTQQTHTQNNTGAANANGAPRPQQQRQPGSSSGQGSRSRSGNGGNGYVPRATSTPHQQPPWQDGQHLTSTTGALAPTSKAISAVNGGKGRRA